jgi:hypothetical protein
MVAIIAKNGSKQDVITYLNNDIYQKKDPRRLTLRLSYLKMKIFFLISLLALQFNAVADSLPILKIKLLKIASQNMGRGQ